MKKRVGVLGVLSFILVMVMFFTGCGNQTTTGGANNETLKRGSINIEDIDWSVGEGVVDGRRYILLDYTNNSKYTLLGFRLTFSERSDLTEEEKVALEEEKAALASEIQDEFEVSDDEVKLIKEEALYMHAEIEKVVDPGETVENVHCYYYDGFRYLRHINRYNYVEPDIATIRYLDGEQIYTVYYDFVSKKYTTEEEVVNAYYWTQTDLGDKIPKPEDKIVIEDADYESNFRFKTYGYSLEDFNAYVEECEALGYTVDTYSHEGYYSAYDAEGYHVIVSYDEVEDSLSCDINAPND